jgi:quinol monooxygenase YgiN
MCMSCELFQNLSDANFFRIESHWKAQTHLIRHIRSDAYKKLLLLGDPGAEPPKIEFYAVSEMQGLDLIEAARE